MGFAGHGGVLLRIRVQPQGSRARDVRLLSAIAIEHEVPALPPHSSLAHVTLVPLPWAGVYLILTQSLHHAFAAHQTTILCFPTLPIFSVARLFLPPLFPPLPFLYT